MKKIGISPLIEKYNELYLKDPSSRVFAPLAEGYRQAGLLDKAQEILRVGIRHNPTYLQGYITLANCYYDLGEYNLAYSNLRPLISENRDNIRLQKLFASICVEIDHKEEALESYKYLLFQNPRDKEISKIVAALESESTVAQTQMINVEKFNLDEIDVQPEVVKSSLDEWIKVDLKAKENNSFEEIRKSESLQLDDVPEEWKMEKLATVTPISQETVAPIKSEKENYKAIEDVPVITHSLVDLYVTQGHLSKAKELLNKILELNPNEESSVKKLAEVRSLEGRARLEVEDEEEGHQRLMDSIDAKLGQVIPVKNSTIVELNRFLDAIQNHTEDRKNSQI